MMPSSSNGSLDPGSIKVEAGGGMKQVRQKLRAVYLRASEA